MKAYFENESTFWKWKHILKMEAHFENESTFLLICASPPWKSWSRSITTFHFKLAIHPVIFTGFFQETPQKTQPENSQLYIILQIWRYITQHVEEKPISDIAFLDYCVDDFSSDKSESDVK